MRAKSLLGLGAEHQLEVSGESPLRRPMLSDLMTDFGPPQQEPFGGTRPAAVRPHIACTLRDVGRGGQGSQSIAQPIRQGSWDRVPSVGREASSRACQVRGSGHTVSPSAALTMPESTLRLSRDLWHLPGSTRRAAAGRLVTHHRGSGPGMIISVVTTASCPRPHRLRADHCLLTSGAFGLKLTQPAGRLPRPPCRWQPVASHLLTRGLA